MFGTEKKYGQFFNCSVRYCWWLTFSFSSSIQEKRTRIDGRKLIISGIESCTSTLLWKGINIWAWPVVQWLILYPARTFKWTSSYWIYHISLFLIASLRLLIDFKPFLPICLYYEHTKQQGCKKPGNLGTRFPAQIRPRGKILGSRGKKFSKLNSRRLFCTENQS